MKSPFLRRSETTEVVTPSCKKQDRGEKEREEEGLKSTSSFVVLGKSNSTTPRR